MGSKRSYFKDWKDFKKDPSNQKGVEEGLKYDYENNVDPNITKWIIEALVFWKFILSLRYLSKRGKKDEHLVPMFGMFLSDFASRQNCKNPYMRVVAMIESMPDVLWRKILWKYNLDFMSFESFLRRLDTGGFDAIEDNYNDLFLNGTVPRAFNWFYRLRKRITVESLLQKSIDRGRYYYYVRYASKGAMSYNLFGLDFGFNAYPNGLEDDTKLVEISPLRFISKKAHADDFIVNTEDGKYWWLYQKARSNYVWRPNRVVALKTHICPGFWYTYLMHLLFWIVSPVAVIVSLSNSWIYLVDSDSIFVLLLNTTGLFTSIWVVLAFLKLFFITLWRILKAIDKKVSSEETAKSFEPLERPIREWYQEHKEVVDTMGKSYLKAIGLCIVFYILFVFLKEIYLVQGFFWACLTMVLFAVYSVHRYLYKRESKHSNKSKFLVYLLTGTWFCRFAYLMREGIYFLITQVIALMHTVWILFGPPLFVLIGILLMLFGLVYLMNLLISRLPVERAEKFFDKMEKPFVFFFLCTIAMTIFLTVRLIYLESLARITSGLVMFLVIGLFYCLLALLMGLLLGSEMNFNPRRKRLGFFAKHLNEHFSSLDIFYFRVSSRHLPRSMYNYDTREAVSVDDIKRFLEIIVEIFSRRIGEEIYLRFLPGLTLEKLEQVEKFYSEPREETPQNYKYYSDVFKKIFKGFSYEKARDFAEYADSKRKARREKWEKIKESPVFSFLLEKWNAADDRVDRAYHIVLGFVKKVFYKIFVEFPKTLYRLIKLFNQFCPYVSKSQILSIDS